MSYCVAWHTPNACESQLYVPNLCVCDTGRRPNINANLDQVIGWKKEKIKLFIGGFFKIRTFRMYFLPPPPPKACCLFDLFDHICRGTFNFVPNKCNIKPSNVLLWGRCSLASCCAMLVIYKLLFHLPASPQCSLPICYLWQPTQL